MTLSGSRRIACASCLLAAILRLRGRVSSFDCVFLPDLGSPGAFEVPGSAACRAAAARERFAGWRLSLTPGLQPGVEGRQELGAVSTACLDEGTNC